jgi:hypothetical protein
VLAVAGKTGAFFARTNDIRSSAAAISKWSRATQVAARK